LSEQPIPNTGESNIDVSGTYVSDRIKSNWTLKHQKRLRIVLKQTANSLEGSFIDGLSGPITGNIEGGNVELIWEAGNCSSGTGMMSIDADESILKGFLLCRSQGMNKYDVVFRRM
jgi:hypothetical protein